MTDLEKVNLFTRREHHEEDVYLFDVVLCDNDIDRDHERFSERALEQMRDLFIGKTGIFDHGSTCGGQMSRIYETSLHREAGISTKDGRPYIALKAKAYMIRTESNAALIREIDGGIKKEVSISCSVAKRICSVCGTNRTDGLCVHIPGRMYCGKICHIILDDVLDAYEWSFVVVPAQVQNKQERLTAPKLATPDWISVKERLPEESGEVLVCCTDGEYGSRAYLVVNYSARNKAFNARDCEAKPKRALRDVTHWMPLPEPPEETTE